MAKLKTHINQMRREEERGRMHEQRTRWAETGSESPAPCPRKKGPFGIPRVKDC